MQRHPVPSRREWLRLVRKADLAPVTKLVAVKLAAHTDAALEAWPSYSQLADGTGRRVNCVRRALRTLERRGLLSRSTDGLRRRVIYRLTKPGLDGDAPPQPVE